MLKNKAAIQILTFKLVRLIKFVFYLVNSVCFYVYTHFNKSLHLVPTLLAKYKETKGDKTFAQHCDSYRVCKMFSLHITSFGCR